MGVNVLLVYFKISKLAGQLFIFRIVVHIKFDIHVPKDKRSKLEPLGKKGIFVGYPESSKAYRVYIPGQKQIEISRDVSFEEDVACKRSRGTTMEIDREDHEASQDSDIAVPDSPLEIQRETPELEDPIDPVDPIDSIAGPSNVSFDKKIPLWAIHTMQGAEKYSAPRGTFRESKRPHKFVGYVALMSHIIESEPSSFEVASK
ncbi:uncharacterized protein LOC131858893 [Cryptomeria japonica]|uniref:uncharacterized protein LOC131858893 n=1 Tax=Cryptomeria japonica TaxID=3369 RepID=UPI0027DA4A6E|nr:uncharacterized protein LOC131858893 [Cryptomeria japonica]